MTHAFADPGSPIPLAASEIEGDPGRYATTFRPVSFSRTTFVVSATDVARAKPATCGLPESISFWMSARVFGAPANSAFAAAALMLAAGIPDPDSAVSDVIRRSEERRVGK